MTMRERVARAIQTKLHPPLAGKPAQAWYLEVADAAIAAMHEPTEAMVLDGWDARDAGRSTTEVWQAMLDAAMKEITDGN